MELSQYETERALWLQRRLKLLRVWNRIGSLFCWPWTFYKETERKWREELQFLYNKKFLLKDREASERRIIGSPLERMVARSAAEAELRQVDEMMKLFQKGTAYGQV